MCWILSLDVRTEGAFRGTTVDSTGKAGPGKAGQRSLPPNEPRARVQVTRFYLAKTLGLPGWQKLLVTADNAAWAIQCHASAKRALSTSHIHLHAGPRLDLPE